MCTYSLKSNLIFDERGSKIIEISEFIFEGHYFKPNEPVKFLITSEPEGWVYIRNDAIGIRAGGKDLEEAIIDTLMVTSDSVLRLLNTKNRLSEKTEKIKEQFESWEMHTIDQQAQ